MSRYLMISVCLAFALSAGGLVTGCTPDTGVKVTRVKKTSDVKSKRTSFDRAKLEMTSDNWKPIVADEQSMQIRNPFRGFSDTIIAENLMKQNVQEDVGAAELQLPEQLYNTKDYRVVAVITGTADPKVYVVDPACNRFVLRRGSLIGNNNGSISSIRRDGVEVYERVGDKGQYVELPLYEKNTGGRHGQNNIQLTLQ